MFKAKLLKLNTLIEEVLLEINSVKFLGFTTVCPYKILPNNICPVKLYFTCLDGFEIQELDEREYAVERIADAYGYILKGQVVDGSLNIGHNIKIKEEYFEEHPYLSSNKGCLLLC